MHVSDNAIETTNCFGRIGECRAGGMVSRWLVFTSNQRVVFVLCTTILFSFCRCWSLHIRLLGFGSRWFLRSCIFYVVKVNRSKISVQVDAIFLANCCSRNCLKMAPNTGFCRALGSACQKLCPLQSCAPDPHVSLSESCGGRCVRCSRPKSSIIGWLW